MYAIQGRPQGSDSDWSLCFEYNENGNRVPCIYFYLHVAEEEICTWKESETGSDYRVVPVEIKFL